MARSRSTTIFDFQGTAALTDLKIQFQPTACQWRPERKITQNYIQISFQELRQPQVEKKSLKPGQGR